MHFRFPVALLILGSILLLSLGNKNGRASTANRGNTGAPGDETSLGQPKTCLNCHNQGPILASLDISVLDADSMEITHYQPGQNYLAKVKINATGNGLQGYGFQMIALRDSGNTDLDGFSDTNPNNYKIASISNGRTYAEHDNISASNSFYVKWTAPPTGTGSVTFYAAGNGVNGNGTTSGDGSGFDALQLLEIGTAANSTAQITRHPMKLSPNPMIGNSSLEVGTLPKGAFQLRTFNQHGKLMWEQALLSNGTSQGAIMIPAADWQAGVYYLLLEGENLSGTIKSIKL